MYSSIEDNREVDSVMIIAIDFDDTLTEPSEYPITGKLRVEEVKRLIDLQKQGNKIVLWTGRKGKYFQEALHLCNEAGLIFDDIVPHKYEADAYIDSKTFKSVEEMMNVLCEKEA